MNGSRPTLAENGMLVLGAVLIGIQAKAHQLQLLAEFICGCDDQSRWNWWSRGATFSKAMRKSDYPIVRSMSAKSRLVGMQKRHVPPLASAHTAPICRLTGSAS